MKQNKTNKQNFVDSFNTLCQSRSPYAVWADCMECFALSIANSCYPYKDSDVWKEREQKYLSTIKKFGNDANIVSEMFAYVVMELQDNPNQDLLGELYMMLGISNSNAGQFFTPYSVCQLMCDITMGDRKSIGKQVHKEGYFMIDDCACGGGATLIACVNKCRTDIFKKFNFQNHVGFTAQDIDITCCYMCYIQMSLLGIAGYVVHGNTLTEPVPKSLKQVYMTPMWFSDVWSMRRIFHNQDILGNKRKES